MGRGGGGASVTSNSLGDNYGGLASQKLNRNLTFSGNDIFFCPILNNFLIKSGNLKYPPHSGSILYHWPRDSPIVIFIEFLSV